MSGWPTDRNRADFRIKEGDYQPRWRNRPKLEHIFKVSRLDVTPFAHAEAIYDWKFKNFTASATQRRRGKPRTGMLAFHAEGVALEQDPISPGICSLVVEAAVSKGLP